jgi:N-acetylglucosaminyl-diphospho-decaprenol L-rhamnosyltransferase
VPEAVDVVVVDFNAGEYLTRCLRSIEAQAGGVEVRAIVVDNASTDGSARRALADHPGVTLIENRDNRGFGVASDQGIAAGSAPWVFLLNPDAEIVEGTLADLLAVAADRGDTGVFGVLVRNPDGSVYPSARKIPSFSEAAGHALVGPFKRDNRWSRAYTMDGWDRTSERTVDWVSGSSMLLRRKALDEVGAFDPGFFMYAEDADLCTRMRAAGWAVRFTPALTVVHDHGQSTRGSRRMIWEHSRSIGRYFEKHHAIGWRRILVPPAKAVLWLRAAVVSRRMWRP